MCKFCLLVILFVGSAISQAVLNTDPVELKNTRRSLEIARLERDKAVSAHESSKTVLNDARAALRPFLLSSPDRATLVTELSRYTIAATRASRLTKLAEYHSKRKIDSETAARDWASTAAASETKVRALLPDKEGAAEAKLAFDAVVKAVDTAANARYNLFAAQANLANLKNRIRRVIRRMTSESIEKSEHLKELTNTLNAA